MSLEMRAACSGFASASIISRRATTGSGPVFLSAFSRAKIFTPLMTLWVELRSATGRRSSSYEARTVGRLAQPWWTAAILKARLWASSCQRCPRAKRLTAETRVESKTTGGRERVGGVTGEHHATAVVLVGDLAAKNPRKCAVQLDRHRIVTDGSLDNLETLLIGKGLERVVVGLGQS